MNKFFFYPFHILLVLLLFGFQSSKFTGKQSQFTVSWEFKNLDKGYDNNNKCKIWIDGELAGESSEKKESQMNSIKLKTTPGSHKIRVVNYAYYEGEWEEHNRKHGYPVDCFFEEWLELKKKTKLFLLFDIDNGTSYSIE